MQKTLLAILAHPDDESFGTGGMLAKYAAEGVDVHVAIATDGAAGIAASGYENIQDTIADHRSQELVAACQILGVTLHGLGYRDSGMTGQEANNHAQAFINADENEAICRVVKLIRELRPTVVVTHDETGGYFHPDHIMCWQIVTPAFHAAADPTKYPELGLEPFQPQRLYYSAFPNTRVKWLIRIMRLRRQDPTQVGRNKDIDLTKLGLPPEKVHVTLNIRPYFEIKQQASKAHGSQGGGGLTRYVPKFLQARIFGKETYQRAYPPVPNGFKEKDLFVRIEYQDR